MNGQKYLTIIKKFNRQLSINVTPLEKPISKRIFVSAWLYAYCQHNDYSFLL